MTEQAEKEVQDELFEDAPGEEASPEEFFGYIARKTDGDFTAARRLIDRYMHRLQAIESEIDMLAESVDAQIATHEAEVEALRDLRKTLVGQHENERTRITWLLQGAWFDFHDDIKDIIGGGQTWKLTNGSISARKQEPKLAIDEAGAIAFIEKMPNIEAQGRLLDYKTSLNRGEMKKCLHILPSGAVAWSGTGEVLGFVVAEIRDEKITVTTRPPAAQEE